MQNLFNILQLQHCEFFVRITNQVRHIDPVHTNVPDVDSRTARDFKSIDRELTVSHVAPSGGSTSRLDERLDTSSLHAIHGTVTQSHVTHIRKSLDEIERILLQFIDGERNNLTNFMLMLRRHILSQLVDDSGSFFDLVGVDPFITDLSSHYFNELAVLINFNFSHCNSPP